MRKIFFLENKGFSDFSPCNFGREACEPSHKFGPHVRGEYLIHFIISGKGSFTTERGTYELGAGEAFLIKPGEITVYQADESDPWEYIWLGFVGKLASRFASLGDVFSFDSSIISELEEAAAVSAGCEELLTGVCFKLSAYLFAGEKREDYSNKVIGYINAHYMENVTISKIADTLSLNRKYLARIFKEKNGITMQDFLINKRLHEAKKLLLFGLSVEECAYMVGYTDQFGFSKAFKKRYGLSPLDWKKTKAE